MAKCCFTQMICERISESTLFQSESDRGGVNPGVPDVRHVARKQHPRSRPIDPIVACKLAALPSPWVEPGCLAPLRLDTDAIGRVGHHEDRCLLPAKQARCVLSVSSVTAQKSMRSAFAGAQHPEVTLPCDGVDGNRRHIVLVREPGCVLISQPLCQFGVVEPEKSEVEVLVLQCGQLLAKLLLVPAAAERDPVVGDH